MIIQSGDRIDSSLKGGKLERLFPIVLQEAFDPLPQLVRKTIRGHHTQKAKQQSFYDKNSILPIEKQVLSFFFSSFLHNYVSFLCTG